MCSHVLFRFLELILKQSRCCKTARFEYLKSKAFQSLPILAKANYWSRIHIARAQEGFESLEDATNKFILNYPDYHLAE